MDRRGLELLERAFSAEIGAALDGTPCVMQTKSTVRVNALVADGLLRKCSELWRGVTIEGYALTHAGRCLYCLSCTEP